MTGNERRRGLGRAALIGFFVLALAACQSPGDPAPGADEARAAGDAEHERVRLDFAAAQEAERTRDNAAVRREFDRRRAAGDPHAAKRDALRSEAIALGRRYQTANPAEKRRLEQRAAELTAEILRLGG